jgi:hypothetical protein
MGAVPEHVNRAIRGSHAGHVAAHTGAQGRTIDQIMGKSQISLCFLLGNMFLFNDNGRAERGHFLESEER